MRLKLGLGLLTMMAGWSLPAADFLPLAPGNTWTYQERATGQAFTVKVGVPTYANDRIYYALKGYVEGQPLVRIDEGAG